MMRIWLVLLNEKEAVTNKKREVLYAVTGPNVQEDCDEGEVLTLMHQEAAERGDPSLMYNYRFLYIDLNEMLKDRADIAKRVGVVWQG